MAQAKKAGSPSALGTFYKVFRLTVLVTLILAVLLVLKRSPAPDISPDPQAGTRVQAKIEEMQQALAEHKPYELKMETPEINSWVASTVALAPPPGTPTPETPQPGEPTAADVQSSVRDLKVELVEDRLRAYVLFDFHGRDLSLLLEGHLSVRDGYLRFEPTAGRLGSMPLPQIALDNAVQRLFESAENREKLRMPREIGEIRVRNGELQVSFR